MREGGDGRETDEITTSGPQSLFVGHRNTISECDIPITLLCECLERSILNGGDISIMSPMELGENLRHR